MNLKKITLVIAIAAIMIFTAFAAFSQYTPSSALDDMEPLVNGMSDLFAKSLGGMSYVGDPVGYAFIRHLAIGIGGGAVLIPTENLELATEGLNIDFGDLKYIPIPTASAFAKISIKRLEFGFKLGGLPQYSIDNFSVQNMILGAKVRYNLGSFNLLLIKGGISAGVLFEYMKGNLNYSTSTGYPIYLDVNGENTKVGTVTTEASLENSWNATTAGAEAQANFQVLFLNFFTGTRISKTFGSATSSINGSAYLEADSTYESLNIITSGPISNMSVSATNKAPGIEVYGFGGVEFKLFIFTITGRGSYNFTGKTLSADVGARLQF